MYVLPAIGVSVRKIPSDALVRLTQEGHQVSINDISVFELLAKGAKFVASGKLAAESGQRCEGNHLRSDSRDHSIL